METTTTRSRIMENALDLFSKHGYKETTTRRIAEEAECNELTVFRLFGTKEKLLRTILDSEFTDDIMKMDTTFEPTGNPEDDLIGICRMMQSNFEKRRNLFRLMLRENLKNDVVREYMEMIPVIWKDLIVEVFSSVIEKYSDDRVNVETASLFLASYVIRSELMKAMLGEDPFESTGEEHLREAVDIFLNGIRGE